MVIMVEKYAKHQWNVDKQPNMLLQIFFKKKKLTPSFLGTHFIS